MENNDKRADYYFRMYEIAINTRNFEIDKFWNRNLFFGGFSAILYTGFMQADDPGPFIQFLISIMGALFSLGWLLANKGAKYWQESWERKVNAIEHQLGVSLFNTWLRPKAEGCLIFRRYPYSVSKIASWLSTISLAGWLVLATRYCIVNLHIPVTAAMRGWSIFILISLAGAFTVFMFFDTKTSIPKSILDRENDEITVIMHAIENDTITNEMQLYPGIFED